MDFFIHFYYNTCDCSSGRWHHFLKGKFLENKQNRRLDHLIYIFVKCTIPYFIQCHQQQVGRAVQEGTLPWSCFLLFYIIMIMMHYDNDYLYD
ncbi:uncharacterized protein EV420DRAFT_1256790 [Desarmillaria tabescens]|uniref:Uncharacterized protein n=1 Tax=Armillaria tabescens TaxID=1929756 RepID=A0AA39NRQ3_ARMTA|nr:uncharacterized protein EV420DRAFT_1256790 [Desarmillaria tabescens]KAK0470465.1 hypothetical protein EV420DRAFT_1256790 [Desarmillaria tabescens]